jgi:hypothetical protein
MITFTMVLGSGAMCLGRIVMMLGCPYQKLRPP